MGKFKEYLTEVSDNYTITAHKDGKSEVQTVKTPKDALIRWVNAQLYAPGSANILSKNDNLKKEFYDYMHQNKDWFVKTINVQKEYNTKELYNDVQTILVDKVNKNSLVPFTKK
jgi:hypothetical protein